MEITLYNWKGQQGQGEVIILDVFLHSTEVIIIIYFILEVHSTK